jgi:excisionase family DNA binding protein
MLPLLITIDEAVERYRRSRWTIYRHLRAGHFEAVRDGRSSRIVVGSADAFFLSRPPVYPKATEETERG